MAVRANTLAVTAVQEAEPLLLFVFYLGWLMTVFAYGKQFHASSCINVADLGVTARTYEGSLERKW